MTSSQVFQMLEDTKSSSKSSTESVRFHAEKYRIKQNLLDVKHALEEEEEHLREKKGNATVDTEIAEKWQH